MDITYVGETCFKLKSKDVAVLISPTPGVMTQDADIALLSEPGGECPPRVRVPIEHVFAFPGEFETSGVLLSAHRSYVEAAGPSAERNLIWVIEIDRFLIGHLGHLGHALDDAEVEEIGSLDILMVPVGARAALKPDAVASVVGKLSPAMIIPYTSDGSDAVSLRKAADKVIKELGFEVGEMKPKLSVNRAALTGVTQVVLLEPKRTP